ncbi:rRNA small subunit 7-methylguanosine (m7G) methyltransferase GidB [Mucinivorans hirudinis]|uniref:Ribosomal RNA small subunit methyltransferase G n=1 Tax=Mucinivorans hirudinis TaxID=1433126 RepID=A0A060RC38_9BACT|nr:rRNA small subunit 7-methylguanosine (m7G) methyltransferase GidB [Mucinivorans hirudinis]
MEQLIKYFPELSTHQREQFGELLPLYRHWNAQINVISRKDIDELYIRHVLHSLAIIRTGLIDGSGSVLDVGCGGGFPGIPLAIMLPQVEFTLCDSIGKKIKVVGEVSQALGLKNVVAVCGRAEDVPGKIEGKYDWVVSRAVAPLGKLIEWSWGKTANGIIALKGGDLSREIEESKKICGVIDIADFFQEEFFETKKIVIVKMMSY